MEGEVSAMAAFLGQLTEAFRFARFQSAGGCTKRGFSGNCSLYIYKARRG